MTIPIERSWTLTNTREFLLMLLRTKTNGGYNKVPKEIRKRAKGLLRHFPTQFDIERAAKQAPRCFWFIRGEVMIFLRNKVFLTFLMFLALSCGEQQRQREIRVKDGASGDCSVMRSSSKQSKITCSDGTIVTINDGRDGENGSPGATGLTGASGAPGANGIGSTCTMVSVPEGVSLTCGEETMVIRNGTDGTDGKNGVNGTSCTAMAVEAGVKITCGNTSETIIVPKAQPTTEPTVFHPCDTGGFPIRATVYDFGPAGSVLAKQVSEDFKNERKFLQNNFSKIVSTSPSPGDVCMNAFDVSPRDFKDGFPGADPALIEWFALDVQTILVAPTDGEYAFRVLSDDGSILSIDGKDIVVNDGQHDPQAKTGRVTLRRGDHDFRVRYFQGPRFQIALEISWQVPGTLQFVTIQKDSFRSPK